MILRSLAVALCGLVLCAADYPPPPAQLEPYIKDGRFDPGDYGWLRGRFQDATPEEASAFEAVTRWMNECRTAATAELREQLTAEGFPDASLEGMWSGPLLCRAVASQPFVTDNSSFAAFAREVAVAEPIARAYLAAVRAAEETARPRSPELARQIEHRAIAEQAVRKGLTWVWAVDSDFPELSPLGRAIFQSRIGLAMGEYDDANTQWLKGVVAERGWPKISDVGEHASMNAWLLVQHADADPVFQVRALRLMEPLVAQGEVSKQNYAYLYDRVMLKLAGKQRYGTQMHCRDERLVPQPLEDEATVNRLRAEMGLGTVEEYAVGMNERSRSCEGRPNPPA
jgi:hypothetical protein